MQRYMGRQDDSVGNKTMHADGAVNEEYESRTVDPPANGQGLNGNGPPLEFNGQGYGTTSGAGAPIYRY